MWFAFTALCPVLFVVAAWAIQSFILDVDNPFIETFGTGDLIPLAALLLLSVYADIRLNNMSSKLFFHEVCFIVVVLMAVIAYGAIKTRGVEHLKHADIADGQALLKYASASWWVMAYAVAHTTYVKFRIERG